MTGSLVVCPKSQGRMMIGAQGLCYLGSAISGQVSGSHFRARLGCHMTIYPNAKCWGFQFFFRYRGPQNLGSRPHERRDKNLFVRILGAAQHLLCPNSIVGVPKYSAPRDWSGFWEPLQGRILGAITGQMPLGAYLVHTLGATQDLLCPMPIVGVLFPL